MIESGSDSPNHKGCGRTLLNRSSIYRVNLCQGQALGLHFRFFQCIRCGRAFTPRRRRCSWCGHKLPADAQVFDVQTGVGPENANVLILYWHYLEESEDLAVDKFRETLTGYIQHFGLDEKEEEEKG